MDIVRAKEILSALADGVNPLTGEILPPEDSCNQAEVVRALHAALAELKIPTQKTTPANAGNPWTAEEDDQLRGEVQSRMPVGKIAAAHARSRGAIRSRMALWGLRKADLRVAFPNDESDDMPTAQSIWGFRNRCEATRWRRRGQKRLRTS